MQDLGYEQWVEKQLHPQPHRDPILQKQISGYEWEGNRLQYWNQSQQELWKLTDKKYKFKDRRRPAGELFVVRMLRRVYSDWQLHEVLVDFWLNHFNVSADARQTVALSLPHFEEEVIRKNAWGNFRTLLEAVAKSPAMLIYLDNASSRASPANENYARELFELHTLGADNYYNHLYNRWKEVPGADKSQAIGYIDEDVYEAARAFTGWTVAGGFRTPNGKAPNTGEFYYLDAWHDHYQKRVLATEFPPHQGPLKDGKKVLDLAAFHPGTAEHLCQKLCQRLVADAPPKDLVAGAVKVWKTQAKASDQIRQVVRYILQSEHFGQHWGKKVKRPSDLLAAMIRATGADFTPNQRIFYLLQSMGERLYSWPTPTGHPDHSRYWASPGFMAKRFQLPEALLYSNWHKAASFDLSLPQGKSSLEIVRYWEERFFQHKPNEKLEQQLAYLLSAGGPIDNPPAGKEREIEWRYKNVLALMAQSPEFQIQ